VPLVRPIPDYAALHPGYKNQATNNRARMT
jgi:hypothetical protein